MGKYITIDVTQEDIDKGERRFTASCPIARALMRAGYPYARMIGGYWTEGAVPGSESDVNHPSTHAMAEFAYRFDHGKPVKPRKFRVPL